MKPEFPLIFNLAISNVPGTNPLLMNWFEVKYKHNSKVETILCKQSLILWEYAHILTFAIVCIMREEIKYFLRIY